ncbi:hypothetical protein KIN20_025673 [Parelaphostrongylus tenuis]|uniref:Uncharacterized protein n=1 Tax=Parelaphostrongylus tenuis TaxID=148309 RepID=A0AAD5MVM2_PARTN|nr:hypothetical protein KIN20_025673 [Parelaphostrongylus tenuis]
MMLAAVNPYSSSSGNHFKIQDVTDDPEYSSYGNEDETPEEGALVEYCRLNKQQQPNIPTICDASTVVSAPTRTSLQTIHSEMSTTTSRLIKVDDVLKDARCHVVDCKCIGFYEHPWRCSVPLQYVAVDRASMMITCITSTEMAEKIHLANILVSSSLADRVIRKQQLE